MVTHDMDVLGHCDRVRPARPGRPPRALALVLVVPFLAAYGPIGELVTVTAEVGGESASLVPIEITGELAMGFTLDSGTPWHTWDATREAAERHRQWEIQRAEEKRRAEELRKRAAQYSSWAETLEQLRTDFVRHRELADAVAGLREAVERRGPEHEYADVLAEYLAWSEVHLKESDPLRRIWLPQGDRPDLSYEE